MYTRDISLLRQLCLGRRSSKQNPNSVHQPGPTTPPATSRPAAAALQQRPRFRCNSPGRATAATPSATAAALPAASIVFIAFAATPLVLLLPELPADPAAAAAVAAVAAAAAPAVTVGAAATAAAGAAAAAAAAAAALTGRRKNASTRLALDLKKHN